ncbi:hypothetical protein, partial [Proteus mirabilis]
RRAENDLLALNRTLEARVAEALAERAVLADIVNGSEAFVQVVDMEGRWIAVNNAAMAEFERIFGVQPQIGMRQVDLLEGHVHQDKLREVW